MRQQSAALRSASLRGAVSDFTASRTFDFQFRAFDLQLRTLDWRRGTFDFSIGFIRQNGNMGSVGRRGDFAGLHGDFFRRHGDSMGTPWDPMETPRSPTEFPWRPTESVLPFRSLGTTPNAIFCGPNGCFMGLTGAAW